MRELAWLAESDQEMSFLEYKRDLDRQAEEYWRSHQEEPKLDAIWKYGLTTDDMAMLGQIDRAFRDRGN